MNTRQLSLFSVSPQREEDIAARTRFRDTIPFFQARLLRDGKSEHTVDAFTSDLQLVADYFDAAKTLGAFTTTDLNEFLQWLEVGRGVPCSRKSYARRVTTLKVFFKWLHKLTAIPHDPANAVLQRSGQAPLSPVLSDDDVQKAFNFTAGLRRGEKPDPRPETLFRLLVDTGIKKNETMRLIREDIERGKTPILRVRQKNAKNVYKERLIELDSAWVTLLDEYLAHYAPKVEIFNCTARNLEYVLDDVGMGADMGTKPSFEVLRWTSAVRDYLRGMEPETIREKLGLSRISWIETFSKIKRLAGEPDEDDISPAIEDDEQA